ncbi:MAG: hypothetical protein FD127_3195 [Acidimicrobiaceae bacterium]|nr:MAG: hypothetical protein FD127_3195 [Acidimicrobiaceae bacterium]
MVTGGGIVDASVDSMVVDAMVVDAIEVGDGRVVDELTAVVSPSSVAVLPALEHAPTAMRAPSPLSPTAMVRQRCLLGSTRILMVEIL